MNTCMRGPSEKTRARAHTEDIEKLNKALARQVYFFPIMTLWGEEQTRLLAVSSSWEAHLLLFETPYTFLLDESMRTILFAALGIARHPLFQRKQAR